MAVYAIGDVQGYLDPLQRLLSKIDFDPAKDRLWFCGDLVNRGPQSVDVLRFVCGLGDRAVTVLGNHDLHLLAMANGNLKKRDDNLLDSVLKARDSDELLYWLRHRPLMHSDKKLGFSLIHAGLPPQWGRKLALACASEVEQVLRDDNQYPKFFARMYGNQPTIWSNDLKGMDRLRFITNCFTRLRYCDLDGNLGLREKGAPGSQNPGYLPWFKIPGRKSRKFRVLFGHWSTLGYLASDNVWGLDTGCVWGRQLTALRIDVDPPKPRHLRCKAVRRP